ncbi:MAG: TRAP transporter large permease subunit [Proteobacteria bacterium]|nr:TRAP transporter large permease subunit [Pseudomonadota bacterium]
MARRSAGESLYTGVDVYIVDTLGELGLFYRLADVVFVGGSLVPHGGQNPLEPARLGCALLFGPHMTNFADFVEALAGADAATMVTDGRSLAAAVGALGGLLLAIVKGVRWDGIRESIIDSGKVIAPILFLLLTAQMYARLLTTGGIVNLITETITGSGFDPNVAVLVMIIIWLILGMLLDSGSIILLTVPIFWPIATTPSAVST